MWRIVVVLAIGAACGKKDKPAASSDTGSGKPVAAVIADATPPPAAVVPSPPPGSLVGKEPPTAESAHVELAYALARWAADPRDPSLYAKDFGGRDVADGRVDLVAFDEWVKKLPATPARTQNATVKTWLDPGTQLTLDESKVTISYFYDHKDQYRELMWRRENGKMHLYTENVNSENSRDEFLPLRNWLPTDASLLGKTVIVRLTAEASFAWLVLETEAGAQLVVDLWPDAPCHRVEPPTEALAKLSCSGKDYLLVRTGDTLSIADHTINVAKGAKITVAP